jgi:hypothetical protein
MNVKDVMVTDVSACRIDSGATNTDPTFNTQNLSITPDAVREFQVQTGTYSAEMGGAGGGQINIITDP